MIRFVHPEAFLLAVPALALLLAARGRRGPVLVLALRIALLALLLALLAEPYAPGAETGRDLVLVVDRSRSMPEGTLDSAAEIASAARRQCRAGDRIALVTFGRDSAVEVAPSAEFEWQPPVKSVDRDATDLRAALDTALALIPEGRRGQIAVVSDGRVTGAAPASAAREALRRGVRVDAFLLRRAATFDVAVEDVQTPAEVGAGEAFQFSAWVRCERPGDVEVRLLRDGEVLASGTRTLRAGLNRLLFRDVLHEQGVHRYEVDIPATAAAASDPVPENNRARAVVRVGGPQRVLCVTPAGREDRLTRSLRAAGLTIVVAPPAAAPLSLDRLDGFRAVVLENVAAGDLPSGAMAALARWVQDGGGGLLMTGGEASFGPGGYHASPLEEALPVSLEIREEQRKFHLAMAIALDRSGSMRANVGAQTKMDLANLGTCAAIELLGPLDSVAVIAVDSQAHVVVPMSALTGKAEILERVRRIESMGGGIFTFTALKAAAAELLRAPQSNKHIVLFADAADAEEPGDYRNLVPELAAAGVTISVIGLGNATDRDAELLRDIAKLGDGRCFFVKDPTELPRVFAQETIQVARSSVVDEPAAVEALPALLAIGSLARPRQFPSVGGYSIAYARHGAQIGARTLDGQSAPLFAFWQHGLGRAATFLGEADGRLSGGLATWDGYAEFFATVVRWVAGNEARGSVFAELRRDGHEAVLDLEVERGGEAKLGDLDARITGPSGKTETVVLRRTGERRLQARVPLVAEGVHRAIVRVGDGEFLRVPPITLPYSPEFEHGLDPEAGKKTLQRITRIAEGRLDPPLAELLRGRRDSAGVTPLAGLCAWLALVALVLEIAVRRLQLALPRVRLPRVLLRRARDASAEAEPAPAPGPDESAEAPRDLSSVLDRARERGRRRR